MMYLDELDTVRFETGRQDLEDNYVFGQAAIMKNIIQGEKITLSQAQFFDSGLILKLLEDTSFVKLFENHIVNIAIFHRDFEKIGTTNLKEITLSKLRQGISGDNEKPFYFSGIDALSNKKVYSDNEQQNIEIPRKMAIEIIEAEGKSTLSDFPIEHRKYFESLNNFANVLNKISPCVEKQHLLTHEVKRFTLGSLINNHLKISEKEDKDYSDRAYIKALKELFELLVAKKEEDQRGNYYHLLDKAICSSTDTLKIKAIVDFYYNFMVACSISGANDYLRELTFDSQTLDEVDEEFLFKTCFRYGDYRLSKKIEYTKLEQGIEENIITWDRIEELHLFSQYGKLQQIYDNLLIKFSAPGMGIFEVVCKTVPLVLAIQHLRQLDMVGAGITLFEAYGILSAIRDMRQDGNKLWHKVFNKATIDDAHARQIIAEIRREALMLKGGK